MLDQAAIYGRVRTAIRAAGNQKLFAEACGISQAYLSDQLNGKRALSDAVLRAAGIKRVVTYVECEPAGFTEVKVPILRLTAEQAEILQKAQSAELNRICHETSVDLYANYPSAPCGPTASVGRVGSELERQGVGVVAASVSGVGVGQVLAWPAHLPLPTVQYVRLTVSKGADNA